MIPPALLAETMAMLDRTTRREVGQLLRRRGLSYGEIATLTAVPKSTIATWCNGISIPDESRRAIARRTGSRKGVPRDTQWRRRAEIQRIRAEARRQAEDLRSDPFWTAGVALYWAEGAKTQRRIELANADPNLLRLFKRWVLRFLDEDAEFSAAVNLHADNHEPEARRFWERQLQLDPASFTRTFVKPDGTGHRKNTLHHGVCRLLVRRSTDMWIRVAVWMEVMAGLWDE